MIKKPVIAVLYHIFYGDSCHDICLELQPLIIYQPKFLFNICLESPDKITMCKTLRYHFPGCFIIFTSNKGKDIGGKLVLFQCLIELEINPDYLLLLRDKKSLQALKSKTWKKDLLKIVSPGMIGSIIDLFQKNDNIGIIGTKEYIIKEPFVNNRFTDLNGDHITGLLEAYQIKIDSFEFIAGTMFWARAEPFMDFFSRRNPLDIRKNLENGNVIDNFSGTVTHSWERLLSWIITSNGYSIKGI